MQLVTCVRRLGGWTRAWWVGAAVAAGVGVPATAPAQTPPAAWGPLLLPSGREQHIDSFFGRGVDICNDGGTIAVTSDYRVGPASDPWLYGLTIYTRTDAGYAREPTIRLGSDAHANWLFPIVQLSGNGRTLVLAGGPEANVDGAVITLDRSGSAWVQAVGSQPWTYGAVTGSYGRQPIAVNADGTALVIDTVDALRFYSRPAGLSAGAAWTAGADLPRAGGDCGRRGSSQRADVRGGRRGGQRPHAHGRRQRAAGVVRLSADRVGVGAGGGDRPALAGDERRAGDADER